MTAHDERERKKKPKGKRKKKKLIEVFFFFVAVIFISCAFVSAVTFPAGNGSVSNPYQITNCTYLQAMNWSLTANYILVNNIDCSGIAFIPIAMGDIWSGNLNGQNYNISNLSIMNLGSRVGMISDLNGNISNVGLVNANVTGNDNVGILLGYQRGGIVRNCNIYGGSSTGFFSAGITGGFVGKVLGANSLIINSTVNNVRVKNNNATAISIGGFVGTTTGSANISYCGVNNVNVTANGTSANYIGGFVGRAEASIYNSYARNIIVVGGSDYVGGFCGYNAVADASVTNSWATGIVFSNGTYTGGFSGRVASAIIFNSYAQVNVSSSGDYVAGFIGYISTGGNISNSYSTGSVNYTGATYRGGFAGRNLGGTLIGDYYDTNTSGQTDTGRGTPLSTSRMMQRASFINWDFISVWNITENLTYPRLFFSYLSPPVCYENWVQYNTTCGYHCGSWDKFQRYYSDVNYCGTNMTLPLDNGTCGSCNYCTPSFFCSVYNVSCFGNPPSDTECLQVSDNTSCCSTTGLGSDCNFTGNVSDFSVHYIFSLIDNGTMTVPSYPYVDLNVSYTIRLDLPMNNDSMIVLYLSEPDNMNYSFPFSFIDGGYQVTLTFTEQGDYPFIINGTNFCSTLTGKIEGVFLVRSPHYITFNLYKEKASVFPWVSNKYENDFAYVTAEFVNKPAGSPYNRYDSTLESFMPYGSVPDKFKKPVFWGQYIDGTAVIKIYDNDTFAFRLIDGQISFPSSYSIPNITKSYGTNIYIGKFVMNGSNQEFNIFLSKRDINPYGWLFNWVYVILVVGAIFISVILFIAIPYKPSVAIGFGLGFIGMLTLLKIVLWLWLGW